MATTANMKVSQEKTVAYVVEAEDGSPAKLDGPLVATVVSGDVTPVVEGTNGLEVAIVPGSTVGPYEVLVRGDGLIGPGERAIEDVITGNIEAEDAARFTGTVSEARPKRTL